MSDSKRILLLNKIKNKIIIFEHIQGFVSHRHFILPFLFENDKILRSQLKHMFVISKQNTLSSEFMDNIYTFISDRMLYDIINEEEEILFNNNNDQYLGEEEMKEKTVVNICKNRIKHIYENCKNFYNYNYTKISNTIIEKYYPNDKDISLFIFDYLSLQKKNNNKDEIKNIKHILSENLNSIIKDNNEDISFYQNKININIVFIGMEHAGKSTTIGHLLYSTKNIDNFQEIANQAYNKNAHSFRYAWIMDKLESEREMHHTNKISSKKFETQKYYFSLIDIQGRKYLIKNALKGIFLGDAAVIVVPADNDGIKNIFSDDNSFKDQILAACAMGIKQVIVAINKMDLCDYSEKIYLEIKGKMHKLLVKIGFNNIRYVCYSGITGQNIVNRYEDDELYKDHINKTPWYKGKTLLEELEQLKQPERLINKPLRISIFDKKRKGQILIGIIKTGILKKNDFMYLPAPDAYYKYECESIEKYGKPLDMAFPGDIVGIRIKENEANDDITLIGNYKYDLSLDVEKFTADIIMINVPYSFKVGYCPNMFCHTKHIGVKLIKLLYKVDRRTNKIIEKNPIKIKNGEKAVALFKLNKQKNQYFTFETYKENSFFGTIILMDNNNIIAVGRIREIKKIMNYKINK